jgi:elongation factor Ts
MGISAEEVRQLRERTGAGMMECKNALVASSGDLDAAAELMRKQGQAKADKKATRVAAQGVIAIDRAADGRSAAMLEVNCETDFVAREQEFVKFAAELTHEALAAKQSDVAALSARVLPDGETVEVRRRALIAKIGENISIRRGVVLESAGRLGSYVHGARIGVLIAIEGGDDALARDLAMHVAAANPRYISASDVPAAELAKEREILTEQATREGKSPEIAAKMVEGRLRKSLAEITLLGQPFVKDPEQSIEKLLKASNARVVRFERFEVGAGIEKKQEDFAAEVMAQVSAAKKLS